MPLGLVDEDEEREVEQISTNREYWIKKGSPESVQLSDKMLEIFNETGLDLQLSYTKVNIRLSKNNQIIPFIVLKPRKKNHIVLILKSQKSEEIDRIIENGDFDDMGYMSRGSRYRLRISTDDLINKKELLKELFVLTEKQYND